MKKFLFLVITSSVFPFFGIAGKLISKEEYVELWKKVAVQQMIDYKIPASITMAQGILESGSGNSDLATKGNNHFGIKCSDWTGEKMYMDDDSKGECFRVYTTAADSYLDHSKFLTIKTRYSKLFDLSITDYKSWAQGLKDAGYATNPKYPEMLVDIIENLKLYQLDALNGVVTEKVPELLAENNTVSMTHVTLIHSNKVKYIVAKKGDTFYKIAKEFDMGLWQLYRYNDLGIKKDVLVEGDIIYLQPKRHHSKGKSHEYVVNKETTLRQISQEEAIKLESLMKLNSPLDADQKINKGQIITVR
ncbi:MAG: glucosaminidase domain-containing protein [Flavobacteriia bacterium]|nr:glucosaminidase domain-containing protein [Flavobacteriia bacterium]